MKKLFTRLLIASGIITMAGTLSSCGEKIDYKAVEKQAEKVEVYLSHLSESNNSVLVSSDVSYTEGENISVNVEVNPYCIDVEKIDPITFKYFTSIMMSENKGEQLNDFINTLSKAESSIDVKLSEPEGKAKSFILSGKDLKKLVTTPRSQLNPSGVSTNIKSLFECLNSEMTDSLVMSSKGTILPIDFESGFIKITVDFENSSDFAKLTLPNLKARALKYFRFVFGRWGDLKEPLFAMFQSLPCDGIIVSFTAKDSDKFLQTTLPWREL